MCHHHKFSNELLNTLESGDDFFVQYTYTPKPKKALYLEK